MPKAPPQPAVTIRKRSIEEHVLELTAEGLEKVLTKWGKKVCYLDDGIELQATVSVHQDDDGMLHGATVTLRIVEDGEVDTESVD